MFGYTLKPELVTNATKISRHNKQIGYDFKNIGDTIVNLIPDNSDFGFTLLPGEGLNTCINGGADLTTYNVNFKSENDSDPNSQISELLVTHIIII